MESCQFQSLAELLETIVFFGIGFQRASCFSRNFSGQRITHADRSDNPCTSTAAASITPFFTMCVICFLSTLVFRRRGRAKNIFFALDQRATVPRAQGRGFLLSLRILQTLTQVVKYRNHKGQQQRLTAPLTTLGRQDQGIQLRCLSSRRFTSPTAKPFHATQSEEPQPARKQFWAEDFIMCSANRLVYWEISFLN